MAHTVKMNHEGNRGYAADQVDTQVTLADLLEQVQQAIEEWGEDAIVVTHQTNSRYGANYGTLARWDDLFEPVDGDDSDDEDEAGGEDW